MYCFTNSVVFFIIAEQIKKTIEKKLKIKQQQNFEKNWKNESNFSLGFENDWTEKSPDSKSNKYQRNSITNIYSKIFD